LAVRKNYSFLILDLILFLAVFVYLILLHERYFNLKKYSTTLLNINEDAIRRIHGEWYSFRDDGEEFMDDSHPYAQDLDIFGEDRFSVDQHGRYLPGKTEAQRFPDFSSRKH
jgi:hypothetical protein